MTIHQYNNIQAIIIQKSLALGGSNSISQKRSIPDLSPLCRPLSKLYAIENLNLIKPYIVVTTEHDNEDDIMQNEYHLAR